MRTTDDNPDSQTGLLASRDSPRIFLYASAMVRLRLTRIGNRNRPAFRIVAADQRHKRSIEVIGHYDPRTNPSTVCIDGERAEHWLSRGARPSSAVSKLLRIEGLA